MAMRASLVFGRRALPSAIPILSRVTGAALPRHTYAEIGTMADARPPIIRWAGRAQGGTALQRKANPDQPIRVYLTRYGSQNERS